MVDVINNNTSQYPSSGYPPPAKVPQTVKFAFIDDTMGGPIPFEWEHFTRVHASTKPVLALPPTPVIAPTLGQSESDDLKQYLSCLHQLVELQDAYRLLQLRIAITEGESRKTLVKRLGEIRDQAAEVAKKASKVKWANLGMSIGLVVSFVASIICSVYTSGLSTFFGLMQGASALGQSATSLTKGVYDHKTNKHESDMVGTKASIHNADTRTTEYLKHGKNSSTARDDLYKQGRQTVANNSLRSD